MADKRMFSRKMISSDAFCDMSLGAQALYFHLCMRADDEGIVDSPNKIMREVCASKEHLDELADRRYILKFDISDVVLIKHWRIHNSIPKDRFKKSLYKEEMAMVGIKENGSYTECYKLVSDCQQTVIPDKNRLDKAREEEDSKESFVHSEELHEEEIQEPKECLSDELPEEPTTKELSDDSLEKFFESVWALYPLKKGKGQISYARKVKLRKIGFEVLKTCIERYASDLKRDNNEKYMQHGSTFFNSGYVDYLDENYLSKETPAEERPPDITEPIINDRFSKFDKAMRSAFEEKWIITGQSLNLGNADSEDIKYLTKMGVL